MKEFRAVGSGGKRCGKGDIRKMQSAFEQVCETYEPRERRWAGRYFRLTIASVRAEVCAGWVVIGQRVSIPEDWSFA